jgi:fused signal recognition particle receptor
MNNTAKQQKSEESNGFFGRLTEGLSKTAGNISSGITDIFTKSRLDEDTIDRLEEVLIMADLGPGVAADLAAEFASQKFDKDISPDEVKRELAHLIADRLKPVEEPLVFDQNPHVVVMVGVNGTGKTTTIGKIADQERRQGNDVLLAAGDTFRAAAIDQLERWATRAQANIITPEKERQDPAALAYQAVDKGVDQGHDLILIDTAGRLHTKSNLMEELEKIVRVINKRLDGAPHDILLTLDATTGQNAINQVEEFSKAVDISGLILTKLDGTAKGGITIALADQFGLPIHFVGVGEGINDLQPFDASKFAHALVGVADNV